MNPEIISVKDFIAILNETLGFAYPLVTIEGEVSSFKVNQGKWVFFDLKDDEATLGCFMPVYQLKVALEDGMKIRVSGTPKLTKWGKFSFTVKSVTLAGEGEMRRAFEILKARLDQEGLFDPARQRPLPHFPRNIGLVTSGQSAAYHDFIEILNQRWGGVTVHLADVQVQGEPAVDQIVGAINYFNQLAIPVDVLVLIRGGGSLEDLQAFNSEQVARAVATSRTPIMVGVGHEVDVSLADFAADLRAATPTDAARLVVPDRKEMERSFDYRISSLLTHINQVIGRSNQDLLRAVAPIAHFLATPRQRLKQLEISLQRDLEYFEGNLTRFGRDIIAAERGLELRQESIAQRQRRSLESLVRVIASFDPRANLRRGYAIVTRKGQVIKSIRTTNPGDLLMIQLADGTMGASVTQAQQGEVNQK